MKKAFIIVIFATIYLQSKAQDATTAKWLQHPVVIDGSAGEWGELNLYDDDTKLLFAIANDSNNIYLCFENTDQANQMKMMRAGMKVSLITKGKNKHDATIEYPLPPAKQTQQMQSGSGFQQSDDSSGNTTGGHVHNAESFRNNYVANHPLMNVSGFADVNGMVSTSNTSGIKAAINWDSASNLIYEISISKKEFYGAGYSPSITTGDITLSVEINALRGAAAENRTASNSESHHWQTGGGGMRGGGGGGMHGGRQFNNNGNNAPQNQSVPSERGKLNVRSTFKQKFVLSNNKTES